MSHDMCQIWCRWIELFKEFPSLVGKLPVEVFLQIVPLVHARYYSIASSHWDNPEEVTNSAPHPGTSPDHWLAGKLHVDMFLEFLPTCMHEASELHLVRSVCHRHLEVPYRKCHQMVRRCWPGGGEQYTLVMSLVPFVSHSACIE